MRPTICFVTRPVSTAKVQVVGEVSAKFANDLARDLNAAVRSVKLDASPIADKIVDSARQGAAGAEQAFDGLADDVEATLHAIAREAQQAFDRVEGAADAAADSVDRATTKMQRDARGRFVKMGTDAGIAGDKIGTEFEKAGEVAEGSMRELARAAARAFLQMANKAGAAAAATATKWVSAWSIIKGAALAATTAAVAGLTAITAFGLKSAAALEQTQIGLESLLGSADAAKDFIKELQAFAAATPFEFADVADASKRILAFGSSVGIARKQVIPTLTVIGDLVSVLGGTSENINSVIRALGQMASKGKVSQEEILQLAEALPGFNANAAIASSLGLSVADTLELITAGGVSAKVGIDALLKGMGQFPGAAGAMAKQAQTLNGVFSTFKDTIAIALTDAFAPVIPQIKEALAQVTPVIGKAVGILAPALGEFLVKLLPLISTAIATVAPLLGVFTDLAGTVLTALGPALESLGIVATELVKALAPLAVQLGTLLGDAIEELIGSGALQEIIKQFVAMTPALIDLLIAVTPLLPPLAQLLALVLKMETPFIQLLALLVDLLAVKALTPALEAVAGALDKVFEVLGPAIDFVTDIGNWPKLFKAFADKVGPIFSDLWDDISTFFAGIVDWFQELPGRAGAFLASLPPKVVGAIKATFDAALRAVGFGIGFLIGAIAAFPQLAVNAIRELPERLAAVWESIKVRAAEAWQAIVDFVPKAIDQIGEELARFGQIVAEAVPAAIAAAKKFVVDGFNGIVAFIMSIPPRIAGLAGQMVQAGRNLIAGLFSGLSEAGGFVGDLASKITGAIKGLLNKVITSINSGIASVDDALPGVTLPRLPSLATGGLTTEGGLANLHPSELVLPLDDRRVVDLLARSMAAAAGQLGQSATLAGDGAPGEIEVRVFIGDKELTDIVNVVVRERDRATKARVKAGSGSGVRR